VDDAAEGLAAVLAQALAVHRQCYPEADEALGSLAEDMAGVLHLTGEVRYAFLVIAGIAAPRRPACADAAEPECPQEAARPAAGEPAGGHGHLCLGCGCKIAEGEHEIRVPGRHGRVRYRHADSRACAAALRAPQPNSALIGHLRPPAGFAWGADRRGAQPVRTVR
jgi:hypothetical protein